MTKGIRLLSGVIGRQGLVSYKIRLLLQGGFALLLVVLGVQFGIFVHRAEVLAPAYLAAAAAGESPADLAASFDLPVRPPGVEGFLPISGFMGLVDWIHQGRLNSIHPAATMLFILFVLMSFLLRKAFCSWLCPIGLLSESLARLGRRLFGRNWRIWRWLDIPLRGLKYLLLGFFLWAILSMSAASLQAFMSSDYNQVADVKMYWFFARVGVTAAVVLVALVLASVFVNGAWCRYLCPYGALMGLVSWASPLRIRRDPASCTDCGLCDRVCMARLPVSRKSRIISPECTGCLDCVASCPQSNTLALSGTSRRRRLGARGMAAAVLILFLVGYASFRSAGLWYGAIPDSEYLLRIPEADRYDHPR